MAKAAVTKAAAKATAVKAVQAAVPRTPALPSVHGSPGAISAAEAAFVSLSTPTTRPAASGYNIFMKEMLQGKPAGDSELKYTEYFAKVAGEYKALPTAAKAEYAAKGKSAGPIPAKEGDHGTIKLGPALFKKASSSVTDAVLKGFFTDVMATADSLAADTSKKILLNKIGQLTVTKDAKGVSTLTFKQYEAKVPKADVAENDE